MFGLRQETIVLMLLSVVALFPVILLLRRAYSAAFGRLEFPSFNMTLMVAICITLALLGAIVPMLIDIAGHRTGGAGAGAWFLPYLFFGVAILGDIALAWWSVLSAATRKSDAG